MRGRFDRPERERFIRYLVVPGNFVIGMKEKMGMALDQPGGEGIVRQIDHPSLVGRGHFRDRTGLSIRSPWTRTTHPGCSSWPSKTALGQRRIELAGSAAIAGNRSMRAAAKASTFPVPATMREPPL